MREAYFDIVMTIEKLHRLFADVMKNELDRLDIRDINSVQCFILYNIGKNEMTVGEVSNRGYYLGSNVTYNLKKMIDHDYVSQNQSLHDRRSSQIKLSDKGLKLYDIVENVIDAHVKNAAYNGITDSDITLIQKSLGRLESFWGMITAHTIKKN